MFSSLRVSAPVWRLVYAINSSCGTFLPSIKIPSLDLTPHFFGLFSAEILETVPYSMSSSQFFPSVSQFSHSVVSDSLWPHGLQHARLPCPSPAFRACLNSCPLSWWCYPTISSSVIPFSFCLQSFPASGSFQKSQFFASGSQSIGVSASALVLPMNIQDWFPLGWTGWISLQSKGLSESLLQHHSSKVSILQCSVFFMVQLTSIHDYWKS